MKKCRKASAILLVVANVVLYRTRLGLRLRACGKHPQAAFLNGNLKMV